MFFLGLRINILFSPSWAHSPCTVPCLGWRCFCPPWDRVDQAMMHGNTRICQIRVAHEPGSCPRRGSYSMGGQVWGAFHTNTRANKRARSYKSHLLITECISSGLNPLVAISHPCVEVLQHNISHGASRAPGLIFPKPLIPMHAMLSQVLLHAW
jgi:hypothetical protein